MLDLLTVFLVFVLKSTVHGSYVSLALNLTQTRVHADTLLFLVNSSISSHPSLPPVLVRPVKQKNPKVLCREHL